MSLLTDLDAFYTEHRRCGELDGDVDEVMVWLACDCGAPRDTERPTRSSRFEAFEWRQERRDRDSARPVTYRHRTRA